MFATDEQQERQCYIQNPCYNHTNHVTHHMLHRTSMSIVSKILSVWTPIKMDELSSSM